MNQLNHDEIIDLADAAVCGNATAKQRSRLNELLSESAEAREVFLRFTSLHGQLSVLGETTVDSTPTDDIRVANKPSSISPVRKRFIALLAVAASLLLMFGLRDLKWFQAKSFAYYDHEAAPLRTVAFMNGVGDARPIASTTILAQPHRTELATKAGALVQVQPLGVFGLSGRNSGVLYAGAVEYSAPEPNSTYSIETSNLRFVDTGKAFRVTMCGDEEVEVESLGGEVKAQSRVRIPRMYWPLDEGNTKDRVRGISGLIGQRARFGQGIIGSGSLVFNNQPDSFFKVSRDDARFVGQGMFACSSGITIEAMFISLWSGKQDDYDQIFRKEDGDCRILLAISRHSSQFAVPDIPSGPAISFGLNLEGQGYSELVMPLDGQQGRPTLAEITNGKPHHLVATYDSFTGEKAIFLDGVKRFSHDFPRGSMVMSGGPRRATIGNCHGREPFHGTIDEVAFYDIGLREEEVKQHYSRVQQGVSYFAKPDELFEQHRWQTISRLTSGERVRFNLTSGEEISRQQKRPKVVL